MNEDNSETILHPIVRPCEFVPLFGINQMFCFLQEWVLRPGNNLVFVDFICDSFVIIFAEQNINSCLPQSLFSAAIQNKSCSGWSDPSSNPNPNPAYRN